MAECTNDIGINIPISSPIHQLVPRQTTKMATISTKKRASSPIYLDFGDDKSNSHRSVEVLPRSHPRSKKKKIAFGWYGGKFSHLDWLLPLLPESHHYCEPFAGSAAVLLNRDPSPVETYNDIDGEVTHFFKILRDKQEELIRGISLTPFSREEYYMAIYGTGNDDEIVDDVEQARRFYIRARQTRTGLAQTASLGRWANCKDSSRSGMSGVVSRWLGGVDALDEIAKRLIRVQIENRPAIDIIRLYDGPNTLFYCDPPYYHETRGDSKAYGFEMDEEQHREFAKTVNQCAAKVAVSGYDHPLMKELFPASKWVKTVGNKKTIHSTKGTRTEILWTNYNPKKQKDFFESVAIK